MRATPSIRSSVAIAERVLRLPYELALFSDRQGQVQTVVNGPLVFEGKLEGFIDERYGGKPSGKSPFDRD